MSSLLNEQACFSDALQINRLKVTKKGFEGSSVFVMPGVGSTAPMQTMYQEIVIDRSFGFILTDSYNIPLFTGIIANK